MWHRRISHCAPLTGNLWQVSTEADRPRGADENLVAKWVPINRRPRFLAGLTVAAHLAQRGIQSGAPLPAVDGSICVPFQNGLLALLRDEPGRALVASDPIDQQFWGDMLGSVHQALVGYSHPRLVRLGPVDPDAPHLSLQPWLRPAVAASTAALIRLRVADQLSYGVVHGDPDPGAFRVDRVTGRMSLVAWGWTATGLLLFDVAGAVAHIGGIDAAAEFLDGYLASGPLYPGELEVGLPIVLRCRWARRADAFAHRLYTGSSTDPDADFAGLAEAQQALAGVAAS
jgi:homoserine kinase type II